MAGKIDARLAEIGIELPDAAAPAANYVPYALEDNTLYIAGQVPFWNGELLHIGKVGDDYSVEDAQQAARVCGLNIIAQAKAALESEEEKQARDGETSRSGVPMAKRVLVELKAKCTKYWKEEEERSERGHKNKGAR